MSGSCSYWVNVLSKSSGLAHSCTRIAVGGGIMRACHRRQRDFRPQFSERGLP